MTVSSADATLAKIVTLNGKRETVQFMSVLIAKIVNKHYRYRLFSRTKVEIYPDMRRSVESVVKFRLPKQLQVNRIV